MLDNAFNHPQFFVPGLGTGGFVDLTATCWTATRTTGRRRCSAPTSSATSEGFAVGRVIRLGLRLRF